MSYIEVSFIDGPQDHFCIKGGQRPLFFLVKKGEVIENLEVSILSFNFVDKVPL